jgi:hypothetical protein
MIGMLLKRRNSVGAGSRRIAAVREGGRSMLGAMRCAFVAIVAISLGGCEREPSPPAEEPGTAVSATVDSRGGTVILGNVSLEIPAGALDDAATITVRRLDNPAWGAVGPAYELVWSRGRRTSR